MKQKRNGEREFEKPSSGLQEQRVREQNMLSQPKHQPSPRVPSPAQYAFTKCRQFPISLRQHGSATTPCPTRSPYFLPYTVYI